MADTHLSTVRIRRARDRAVWRAGLVVSLLLHVLVFLAWRGDALPGASSAAAGPDRGDPRVAAGAVRTVNIRAAPRTPVVPPPEPVAVEVAVERVEFDEAPDVDPAELLGERPGLDEAPGVEDGAGSGDRGSAESGTSELQPPSPKGMIIPPTNSDLDGTEVQVWVFVDSTGRVVPDSTRLEPPTEDRSFNRRLIEEASAWVFRPATRRGTPVAAWFPYRIIM
ncbi:MAG: hypothetical protein U5R14_13520 [Gemmatimonadota bacterium]|nr:hypothetical protein [Gemmatimonadota bacterium]